MCIRDRSRTRDEEENLVSAYIFTLITEACGINFQQPIHDEIPEINTVKAKKSWIKLINNKIDYVGSHNAKPELIEVADLVTEMNLIKHPFKDGVKAQLGVEF